MMRGGNGLNTALVSGEGVGGCLGVRQGKGEGLRKQVGD